MDMYIYIYMWMMDTYIYICIYICGYKHVIFYIYIYNNIQHHVTMAITSINSWMQPLQTWWHINGDMIPGPLFMELHPQATLWRFHLGQELPNTQQMAKAVTAQSRTACKLSQKPATPVANVQSLASPYSMPARKPGNPSEHFSPSSHRHTSILIGCVGQRV